MSTWKVVGFAVEEYEICFYENKILNGIRRLPELWQVQRSRRHIQRKF